MELEALHLNEKTRTLLSQSDQVRIEFIRRQHWIKYSKASEALSILEDLFTEPQSHRMSNLLLVAETRNGKTMIVNRFLSLHPPDENKENDSIICPVLIVQSPPTPDEGRFYSTILKGLNAPFNPNAKPEAKLFAIEKILPQIKLKLLVIEEIHNIIAGPSAKHRQFLNALRYLCNVPQINIVATGTMEAYSAMQVDPQLANRFEPFELPRWKNEKEYLRLLTSLEQVLPLQKPSHLASNKALSEKIYAASEGIIGEIVNLVTKAAIQSVRNGEESITMKVLNSVSYRPPSKRRNPLGIT